MSRWRRCAHALSAQAAPFQNGMWAYATPHRCPRAVNAELVGTATRFKCILEHDQAWIRYVGQAWIEHGWWGGGVLLVVVG